jgi:hypothetical protein
MVGNPAGPVARTDTMLVRCGNAVLQPDFWYCKGRRLKKSPAKIAGPAALVQFCQIERKKEGEEGPPAHGLMNFEAYS